MPLPPVTVRRIRVTQLSICIRYFVNRGSGDIWKLSRTCEVGIYQCFNDKNPVPFLARLREVKGRLRWTFLPRFGKDFVNYD
jgi:hypothetical protein